MASILNRSKKPACIESFVGVGWLTWERVCLALRKAQMTSILNKSAVVEHVRNILLKNKVVLFGKNKHIKYLM